MDARLRQASPLIVIGMHRSGTRALARILERLGVFMGADQQGDCESVTFLLINEGLLHQCGAFWSEPMSAHFALAQPELVEHLAAGVEATLAERLPGYTGPSGPQLAPGAAAAAPFGWKDPRNTFTLPVWKQIFPNLRTLHIVRHGIDVAASLARRHAEALRASTGESVPSALTVIQEPALGILSSRRGWTLAEALTMWEQYVEKARQESASLGARALELRFEDLLVEPGRVIATVAEFCGLPVPARPAELGGRLEPSRAFAFRRDPALVEVAASARDVLARYGYEP